MVSGQGWYRDAEGNYKDIGDEEVLEVFEGVHKDFGAIKYIIYGGQEIIVQRAVLSDAEQELLAMCATTDFGNGMVEE